MAKRSWCVLLFAMGLLAACGDDDDEGTEADRLGVGAACTTNGDCLEGQSCLPFKGGYCGIQNCQANVDCPDGSACVTHDDGINYCFRICVDKSECNFNRPADIESNCSSNIDFAEPTQAKACVPPSS